MRWPLTHSNGKDKGYFISNSKILGAGFVALVVGWYCMFEMNELKFSTVKRMSQLHCRKAYFLIRDLLEKQNLWQLLPKLDFASLSFIGARCRRKYAQKKRWICRIAPWLRVWIGNLISWPLKVYGVIAMYSKRLL